MHQSEPRDSQTSYQQHPFPESCAGLSGAWYVLRLQKTRLERIGVSTSQRLSVSVLSVLTSWTRLVLERLDVLERIDVLADSPSKSQELSPLERNF